MALDIYSIIINDHINRQSAVKSGLKMASLKKLKKKNWKTKKEIDRMQQPN